MQSGSWGIDQNNILAVLIQHKKKERKVFKSLR